MKYCPNCGAEITEDVAYCPNCGGSANVNDRNFAPAKYPAFVDPYDHTGDFDPRDISENKIYAMLPYLMSIPGIIIALLAGTNSPYVAFHVRQAVKIDVTAVLLGLAALFLCWTVIVPLAVGLAELFLLVLKIIMFVSICQGRAKEPLLIRSLGFLK